MKPERNGANSFINYKALSAESAIFAPPKEKLRCRKNDRPDQRAARRRPVKIVFIL